ncbi:MAG: SPASM domain-containing protein, partial [Magnetococcales bacterium]|nr:SPASM domain-containing protein [Magnetococcales bacterium]
AKSVGIHVFLSTVVHHNGMKDMRKMVEFARKKEVGVVFSLACISGSWDEEEDVLLTSDEWSEVQAYMRENRHIRSDWTINFSTKVECPGGREKCNISPYGDIMGCGMNFVSFGNVRQEPLAQIMKRMGQFPYFKDPSPDCLIGAHPEYIDRYIRPLAGKQVPVQVDKHPTNPIPFSQLDENN